LIWLCTAGQQIDWLEMERGTLEILHVYLGPDALLDYAPNEVFRAVATQSLRYAVSDPLLEQIGCEILAEMQAEKAGGLTAGRILGGSLLARLLQSHSTSPLDIALLDYRKPENSTPDVSLVC